MIKILTWYWRQEGGGHKFSADDVNKWAQQLEDNLTIPHKLACVTDIPKGIRSDIEIIPTPRDFIDMEIPSWSLKRGRPQCLRRLALFSPDAERIFGAERLVSMDLDCRIYANLDSVFDRNEDFIITHSSVSSAANPYNGSMMMLNVCARTKVYSKLTIERAKIAGKVFIGSDQAWIAYALGGLETTWTEKDGVYLYHPGKLKRANGQISTQCKILFQPGANKLPFLDDPIRIKEVHAGGDGSDKGAEMITVKVMRPIGHGGRKNPGQKVRMSRRRAAQFGKAVSEVKK